MNGSKSVRVRPGTRKVKAGEEKTTPFLKELEREKQWFETHAGDLDERDQADLQRLRPRHRKGDREDAVDKEG